MSTGTPGRPLAGKRIMVTRARAQASSLVTALTELGADVVELPTIETLPPDSSDKLDEALRSIARYQWLIFTSANTVRCVSERIAVLGLDLSILASARKAAIGAATAAAMREQGIGVDLVPEPFVAEALVEALSQQIGGARVLLARASVARDVIPDGLTHHGAQVDVVDAYRTVIPAGAIDRLKEAFADGTPLPDAVTFASSSAVNHFACLWSEAGYGKVPLNLKAVSIGPITSAALRRLGLLPVVEAARHDIDGMVDAVLRCLQTADAPAH